MAISLARWFASRPARRPARPTRTVLAAHPLEARDVPAIYTVSNTNDSGTGSLRQAILDANTLTPNTADTIQFSVGLSGTVTLGGALPTITDSVTVAGPGKALTVSGNDLYRVFTVSDTVTASPSPTFVLQDLTVAKGSSSVLGGGGLAVFKGSATVTNVAFSGNKATSAANGGAILMVGTGTTLNIVGSAFDSNSATGTGNGGAVYVTSTSTLGGSPTNTVQISSTTFTNNSGIGTTGGGALYFNATSSTLNIAAVTATANTTAGSGGALYISSSSATLVVSGGTFANNTATGTGSNGGALSLFSVSSVTVTDAAFTANSAAGSSSLTGGGGGVFLGGSAKTVFFDRCLFNGNTATAAAAAGGGAVLMATGSGGFAQFGNSTFVNNSAARGGALVQLNASTLNVYNSTIAGNAATVLGGGLARGSTTTQVLTTNLESTVVAQNTAGGSATVGSADIGNLSSPTWNVGGGNNFVGVPPATTGAGSVSVAYVATGDPVLGPLQNYGGPTLSRRPITGSPVIDAGNNVGGFTADQRGLARSNGPTDIGAVERQASDVAIPTAALNAAVTVTPANSAANTPYQISVAYADEGSINTTSLDGTDLTVARPAGVPALAFQGVTYTGTGGAITATYSYLPPGGSWDGTDQGVYTVSLTGSVTNNGGTAVPAATLGTFTVALPTTFAVTTTADSGPGSLRAAVAAANALPGTADTVSFSLPANSTVTLTGAELVVTDDVTVQGPGAASLTIRNAGTGRTFNLDNPTGTITVNFSGVSLTGARTATTGGAIYSNAENVTLTGVRLGDNSASTGAGLYLTGGTVGGGASATISNSTVSGNTATNGGTGLFLTGTAGTTVTITDSTFSDNTAGSSTGGAAIYAGNAASVTVTRSNLSNNTSVSGGAVFFAAAGVLTVSGSLLSYNTASTTSTGGGAISVASTTLTVINSTLANNTAAGNGGAIRVSSAAASVTIRNSTLVGNTAGGSGGAVYVNNASTPQVTQVEITSSILSGNTATVAGNTAAIALSSGTGTLTATKSALGDTVGYTLAAASSGNLIGQALKLSSLGNYGGSFPSVYPLPGSPVLDAGSNPNGLLVDVRGLTRTVGGGPDIGAAERDGSVPVAAATAPDVTASGGTTYTFTVTYTDDTAVNNATANGNKAAVTVTGPGGPLTITSAAIDTNTPGTPRTVTYTAAAPGGTFDAADFGTYTIAVVGGQVFNAAGKDVQAGPIGTFKVAAADTFVVTNANDSGPGSLRAAVLAANGNANAADTIAFDAAAFAANATITLGGGELTLTDSVTIAGPTGSKLTLVGGAGSRLLNVTGVGQTVVKLSNLALTGGSATGSLNGGAVLLADDSVQFTNVTITGNTAPGSSSDGGAVYADGPGAVLTFTNSTMTGNTAGHYGGAVGMAGGGSTLNVTNSVFSDNQSTLGSALGGAVYVTGTATVAISGSRFQSNKAVSGGGAVYLAGVTTVSITGSVFAGNAATSTSSTAGALSLANTVSATITNSTFTGNSAGTGGVIRFGSTATTLTVNNSTLVGNTATVKGGAVFGALATPNVTLYSTVVAENAAPTDADLSGLSTITATYSAIGTATGYTLSGASGNNVAPGTTLLLLPAANLGGVSPSVGIRAASPLRDAGGNTLGLTTDGRGAGFARTVGTGTDIGAFERTPGPDVSAVTAPDVGAQTGTYTFTVTYADDSGGQLLGTSLGGNTNAVSVAGPAGALTVTGAVVNLGGNGTPRTVTYTAAVPGGAFAPNANGVYTVSLNANQVQTVGGAFVPAGTLARFTVAIGATYTVTNANDSGTGSLRAAVDLANVSPLSADTIAFAGGLGTVTLATAVTITGNTAVDATGKAVTLTGAAGVFNVSGTGVIDVRVTGLTVANSTAAAGSALLIADERVTLANVLVTGNSVSDTGSAGCGVVQTTGAAALTISDSTFTNNSNQSASSTSYGAAVYVGAAGSTVSVTRSLFSANTGNAGAGLYVNGASTTTITDSLFAGNTARTAGGAARLEGQATITQTTFSGNAAGGSGSFDATAQGGAVFLTNATATVTNGTFTGNSALAPFGNGLGGAVYVGGGSSLTLTSTVVGGNTATAAGQDLFRLATNAAGVSASNSLIGVADDGNQVYALDSLNRKGTQGVPLDPQLGPLASNGGPLQTHLPLAGSPARDGGSNPLGLTTDARGAGFPRELPTGFPDIGAAEATPTGPVAALGTAPPLTAGAASYQFTVRYGDATAIKAASANGNTGAVAVTGPAAVTVTAAVIDTNSDGTPRTVTYTLTAGAAFDPTENGTYTVSVSGTGAVQNTAGTAVPAGPLGTFTVAVPDTFVVTTTADSGDGSLRAAVEAANLTPAADVVTFNLTNPTTAQTIALTSGEIAITQPLTIVGPANGAQVLTVSGGKASRIFNIDAPAGLTVGISDLAFADGFASDYGGAIRLTDDTLTLERTYFVGNQAGTTLSPPQTSSGGGAIHADAAGTVLTVRGSTFEGNVATVSSTVAGGGAIQTRGAVTVTLENSTFSGNQATGGVGGAFTGLAWTTGSVLDVRNSTFANNAANRAGGAIRASSSLGLTTITASVFAANTSQTTTTKNVSATVTTTNSVYDDTTGLVEAAGSLGTVVADALLDTLKYNGGSTKTHALLDGSPARDVGGTTTLVYDQRGPGFARISNGKLDAGAFEAQVAGDGVAPTASGTFGNVTTRKGATYTFAVTLADNVAVQAASVQGGDFTVTGPNGYSQAATLVGLSPNADGSPLVATLSVPAPGGSFDVVDNGTYTVSVTGSITDTSGNAVKAGSVGTFAVQAPVSVQSVVTKLSDGTTTSLTTTGQRSLIPNLVVTYDGLATGANLAASYKLLNTSTNATVAVNVSTTTVGGKTVATVTPVAPLANAYYTFTAFGTAITTTNLSPVVVGLDGDNNGTAGGDYTLAFHRFAGDVTGDTAVDGDDLAALAAAFNSVDGDVNYRAYLDLDGDGAVDGNDLAIFAQSFLLGIL